MRLHLLDHLNDMVKVAALRGDENAIAVLHRIRHMADTLPTYFEQPAEEPLQGDVVYGKQRIGTTDTGMAMKAAQEELAARQSNEADKIDPPDPAKELRANEELFHQ